MAKDYYKILGVDKNATDEEIKKQFRKQSIKWHPDRWTSKSEKEQKEAEEKFKEVAEAYSVLSDPEKKAKYERYGDKWEQMSGGGGFGDDIEEIMRNMHGGMFNDFFGNPFGRRKSGPESGKTIQMQYPITIEEIYKGVSKDIEVDVQVRCKTCSGTGGDTEVCPNCKGQGVITHTQYSPFGTISQQTVCPSCHGTGKKIVKKCSDCNGTGFKTEKRKIKLSISPFTANHTIKKYTGMGYESKDKNGVNGDLIIQVVYDIDSSKYAISGNDIYEKITIPYYDCILGTTKKVKLPSGKEKEIKINPLAQEGDKVILQKEGIGYGNYIFIISVGMPKRSISSKLNEKEKDLLEQIKKLHS